MGWFTFGGFESTCASSWFCQINTTISFFWKLSKITYKLFFSATSWHPFSTFSSDYQCYNLIYWKSYLRRIIAVFPLRLKSKQRRPNNSKPGWNCILHSSAPHCLPFFLFFLKQLKMTQTSNLVVATRTTFQLCYRPLVFANGQHSSNWATHEAEILAP